MIEITSDIYAAAAQRLRERIGDGAYFNGSVEFDSGTFCCRLKITAIIYRADESLPEGVFRRIADVVPVWWEFSTVCECGETLNDFSFAELRKYIIEQD